MKITKEKSLGIALLIQMLLYCAQSVVLTLCFSGAGQRVTLMLSCVTAIAVFGIPLLAYCKLASVNVRDICKDQSRNDRTRKPQKNVLLIFFGIAITVTAVNVFGMLTELIYGFLGKSTVTTPVSDPLTLVLVFARNVIVASIMEELLFRGAVLDAFSEKKRTYAIMASALLFALMHYSLGQFLYALAAGAVIATLAVITGSVGVAIIVHMAQNLVSFVFSVLALRMPENIYARVADIAFLLFFAIAVLGVIYFVRNSSEFKATVKPITADNGKKPAVETLLYAVLALLLTVLNF